VGSSSHLVFTFSVFLVDRLKLSGGVLPRAATQKVISLRAGILARILACLNGT
jgi:hypothetical protein